MRIKSIISLSIIFLFCGCSIFQNQIKPDEKFSVEVKKAIEKKVEDKKKVSSISDIETKLSRVAPVPVSVQLKNISLENFISVIFTEILKLPYVLDGDIIKLEKKVDVEIPSGARNLFPVVVAVLEKYELEIDDVEGVVLISMRKDINQGKGNNQNGKEDKKKTYADCVYTFKPSFSRAVDLQKSVKDLIKSEESTIIVHESNNSLIIKSTAKEKKSIIKLLHLLDERRKQVAVDVTVAEVTLSGDLAIGFQGFLDTNLIGLDMEKLESGISVTGSFMISDWLKIILQIGEKKGLINIRSNPYMLISDGSKSSITIGSEYPILTKEKSTDTGEIVNQVEYRKTGIILNLEPVVSGDDIHMNIKIELSEGAKNEISSIQSPSILTRQIESAVVVKSGQSLVLGGLIAESKNVSENYLLKKYKINETLANSRTELVIILNVNILDDKNQSAWFDILRAKYKNNIIEVN